MIAYTDRSFVDCLRHRNIAQIAKDLAVGQWLENEKTPELDRRIMWHPELQLALLLERVP